MPFNGTKLFALWRKWINRERGREGGVVGGGQARMYPTSN